VEFSNSFTVNAPLDRVWVVLTDPREVTPCVPGAQITEMVDDTHFNGTVKIKLGAVQMSYRGTMEMRPDEAAHTIVLRGKGTATGGGGGASGTLTVTLVEAEAGTAVDILSQVDVTGRVAQFGRGIMQDVSNRLIKEFSSCLQQRLSEGGQSEEPAAPESAESAPPPDEPQTGTGSAQAASASVTTAPVTAGSSRSTSELSITTLLLDITRSRIAAGLRELAARIEPR
jgi:carbon monoxide dehydrogenase subunit G